MKHTKLNAVFLVGNNCVYTVGCNSGCECAGLWRNGQSFWILSCTWLGAAKHTNLWVLRGGNSWLGNDRTPCEEQISSVSVLNYTLSATRFEKSWTSLQQPLVADFLPYLLRVLSSFHTRDAWLLVIWYSVGMIFVWTICEPYAVQTASWPYVYREDLVVCQCPRF